MANRPENQKPTMALIEVNSKQDGFVLVQSVQDLKAKIDALEKKIRLYREWKNVFNKNILKIWTLFMVTFLLTCLLDVIISGKSNKLYLTNLTVQFPLICMIVVIVLMLAFGLPKIPSLKIVNNRVHLTNIRLNPSAAKPAPVKPLEKFCVSRMTAFRILTAANFFFLLMCRFARDQTRLKELGDIQQCPTNPDQELCCRATPEYSMVEISEGDLFIAVFFNGLFRGIVAGFFLSFLVHDLRKFLRDLKLSSFETKGKPRLSYSFYEPVKLANVSFGSLSYGNIFSCGVGTLNVCPAKTAKASSSFTLIKKM